MHGQQNIKILCKYYQSIRRRFIICEHYCRRWFPRSLWSQNALSTSVLLSVVYGTGDFINPRLDKFLWTLCTSRGVYYMLYDLKQVCFCPCMVHDINRFQAYLLHLHTSRVATISYCCNNRCSLFTTECRVVLRLRVRFSESCCSHKSFHFQLQAV